MFSDRPTRNLEPLSISGKVVDLIEENLSRYDVFLEHASSPEVVSEVIQFSDERKKDRNAFARRCILFAILSPQTYFDKNTLALQKLLEVWNDEPDISQIQDAVGDVLYHKTKARNIYAVYDLLNTEGLDEWSTYENILTIKGMGRKTSSFAMALIDANAPVFTLDVHMLRSIVWAVLGKHVNPSITPASYVRLQDIMVRWTKTNGLISPFVAQWSIWNMWGFNRHVSHLGIIGRGD